MLTLYTTPVVYLYLDRLRLWGQRDRRHTHPVGLDGTYRARADMEREHRDSHGCRARVVAAVDSDGGTVRGLHSDQ